MTAQHNYPENAFSHLPAGQGLVTVSNDTMEPTLTAGSIAVVDYLNTSRGDGLALVKHAGQKKLVRLSTTDESITLFTDNKRYPVYTVKPGEIEVVGRVVRSYCMTR